MPIKRVWSLSLVLFALLSLALRGNCLATPYAFIPDYDGDSVHVVDVSTEEEVCDPIPVGAHPIGVAVSSNGRHAFVTNQGSDTVSLIDASAGFVIVATISVESDPVGVAVAPDGKTIFIANSSDNSISIIETDEDNLDTLTPIYTVELPETDAVPYGVAVWLAASNGDQKTLNVFVTNSAKDSVSVIEVITHDDQFVSASIKGSFAVGTNPLGIALDGEYIYVANAGNGQDSGTVSPIRISKLDEYIAETAFFTNIPSNPDEGAIYKPYGVAVSPDNGLLYVTNHKEDSQSTSVKGVVSVFQRTDDAHAYVKDVKVRKKPHGIAISPESNKILVANRAPGIVSSVPINEEALPTNDTASDIADIQFGSPIALGQFIGNMAPQRPTDLTATVVSDTQVMLEWTNSEEGTPATGFLINARTDASEAYTEFFEISDGTLETCIVTGLDEGTTYYFHIAAVNEIRSSYADRALKSALDGAVRSTFSEEDSAKTNPAAPSDLMATDTSAKEIKLQWTDNSNGESHFVVERKKISEESTSDSTSDKEETEAAAEDYKVIASDLPADTTSYSDQDKDLEANASYLYRVQAVDASNQESEYSNEVEAEASDKCFIATAAFGSLLEPHVMTLRKFRDAYLRTNIPGRAFVRFYYATSPPIAEFIGSHAVIRTIVRWSLIPVVVLSHCTLQWGLPMTLTLFFSLSMGAVFIRRYYLKRKSIRA